MSEFQLRINILLPCSRAKLGREWGDQFFGLSLSKALIACGADARLVYAPRRWSLSDIGARQSVDLVVRGKKAHHAKQGRPFLMWVISNPETLDDAELSSAAHIFAASEWLVEDLQSRGYPASFLPQCTDPAIFAPEKARQELKTSVLFVGNRRVDFKRSVVERAIDAGFRVSVWGRGWKGSLPEGVYAGKHIRNEMLGAHYASASVVLNDHMEAMRTGGFASNRVYDVLASGSELVSDGVAGIPEDLRPHVHSYETANDLPVAIESALDRAAGPRAEALTVAAKVSDQHSFENRAGRIIEQIQIYQRRRRTMPSRVSMLLKKRCNGTSKHRLKNC
jgi:hypothetical protein